jgi:hypothetical protein
MNTKKTILPGYSVAGGDTVFEGLKFTGTDFILIQVYHTTLNKTDHKIRLQESTDGVGYEDSEDENGNNIEMTLDQATTAMMKFTNFNTNYYRVRFIEGTTGTGTISKINFITS